MDLYLDNAAAMRPTGNIPERFSELLRNCYVNGEAGSLEAFRGRKLLAETDEKMLFALLGKDHNAVSFYTNSGTEALNGAGFLLQEELKKDSCGRILTTRGEHPAMLQLLLRLAENTGRKLEFIPLDPQGGFAQEKLKELLAEKEKIDLVAIHHVQSETGRIQDLVTLRNMLNEKDPSIILLADTIQSAGKIPLPWKEAKLDFAFLSGQKVGSPSGGILLTGKKWKKKVEDVRFKSHLLGRCPLPCGILTAETFTRFAENLAGNMERVSFINHFLREKAKETVPDLSSTLPPEKASPWILHFLTYPLEGAILTRMLGEKNITVSAGSACSAETNSPSPVLLAMGIPEKKAFGSLRISFSGEETEENITELAVSLRECMEKY